MAEKREGRTTILADKAIQTLFKTDKVIIKDHTNAEYANNKLFHIVRNRLETEHKGTKSFKYDRANLTITIEKYDKQLR